jgi:hypothetical protein
MLASANPVWLETVDVLRWPVVVVVGLLILTTPAGRRTVEFMMGRVSSLSFSGVSLKLTEKNATETKTKIEDRLTEYAKALDAEFKKSARTHRVRDRLEAVLTEGLAGVDRATSQWRATVHIQDVLYDDSLYQLVDYYPSGGGVGRRFSIRFGMLGRTWRLRKSRYYRKEISLADLVEIWGMTHEQAERAAVGRKSFMAVILTDASNSPVGVLYVDGVPEDAFGVNDDRLKRLAGVPSLPALEAAVSTVYQHMVEVGPGVGRVDEN